MVAPVLCTNAVSLLPSLEPIAGTAIAINLAYLNLPIFGYIIRVKDKLNERLGKIDQNVKNGLVQTPWFKQITALTNVDTLDQEFPSLSKPWISAPGVWGFLYNVLFYWRLARAVSLLLTAYAIVVLTLGAAHNSGWTAYHACAFDSGHIGTHLFWITIALLWPIMVVATGGWICGSSVRFVNYQTSSLETAAIAEANEVLNEATRAAAAAKAGHTGAS